MSRPKVIQRALRHPNKLGAGAERRKNLSGRQKVEAVMAEFKRGTLHSGSGEIVKNRDQAIAIALSEAGLSRKNMQSSHYRKDRQIKRKIRKGGHYKKD